MKLTGKVEALSIGPNGNVAEIRVAGLDAKFIHENWIKIWVPAHFDGRDLHLGEELNLELTEVVQP